MSSRSKKQFKQACKNCDSYYFPAFLWENDEKKKKENDKKELNDNQKPHMSHLCQACKLGKCN